MVEATISRQDLINLGPQLEPAAKALAAEAVRLKGKIADHVIDDVLTLLDDLCVEHYRLNSLPDQEANRQGIVMSERLKEEARSELGS